MGDKRYAVDALFGDDKEVHGVMSWHELQELLTHIIQEGRLRYIEVDEIS
jgi:hypothetical protein